MTETKRIVHLRSGPSGDLKCGAAGAASSSITDVPGLVTCKNCLRAIERNRAARPQRPEVQTWNQLREKVTYQRDVKRDQADREGNARLHGAAEALDWILATMDRMEAGQ